MHGDCAITARLLKQQRTMFRLAESGHGWSQKAIHLETGMGLSSIGQYARGETAMGGAAILKLAGVKDFPAELLTLLFEGTGRTVIDAETAEADWLGLAAESAGLAAEICHDAKDGFSPSEVGRLRTKTRALIAEASSLVEQG
jgi:transcriptional regulator with XRE-family HTH domain